MSSNMNMNKKKKNVNKQERIYDFDEKIMQALKNKNREQKEYKSRFNFANTKQ